MPKCKASLLNRKKGSVNDLDPLVVFLIHDAILNHQRSSIPEHE
jgi:hypothetical protein